jgi:hypothetical protein
VSDDDQEPHTVPDGGFARETASQESNPSSSGRHGLEGDLGISSERTEMDGIEGTGSLESAQGHTDGESALPEEVPDNDDGTREDKPDETSPVTHVDRTVGEVQPDPVTNKHEFDPRRNPGH